MSRFTIAAALLGFATFAPLAKAEASEQPRAFLELFTSQGCASCPAADALLQHYAQREDVLAVTMPVKLWDFLGWADTLATELNTKRQIAYSVARGDRDVFTPQLVVNGRFSVIGSDREAVDAAIERTPEAGLPLPITLTVTNEVLSVSVGEPRTPVGEATLWLLIYDKSAEVPVEAGENRGRQLTYYNVVRDLRPIGMWKGEPMEFDLPLSDLEKGTDMACMVIAQVETFKGPGRIVGAGRMEPLFPARPVANTSR